MKLGLLEKLIKIDSNDNFSFDYNEIEKIPEFAKLKECRQPKKWHGEGDAFTHTKLVCENALNFTEGTLYTMEEKYILLAAALFHDIGKGKTTVVHPIYKIEMKDNSEFRYNMNPEIYDNGIGPAFSSETVIDEDKTKCTSYGHDIEGEKITRRLLWDTDILMREQICKLVRYHMFPLTVLKSKNYLNKILDFLNIEINLPILLDLKTCDLNGSYFEDEGEKSKDLDRVNFFLMCCSGLFDMKSEFIDDKRYLLSEKEESIFDRYGIMLIGLPGSGKDTFIKKYLSSDEYMPISRDEIRAELGFCKPGEKYVGSSEEEKTVTDKFYEKLKTAIDWQFTPVINNINLKSKYRNELKERTKKYGIKWIYIYIEADSLKENKKRRKGQISDEVFDNMICNFDFPTENECERLDIYISEKSKFNKIK